MIKFYATRLYRDLQNIASHLTKMIFKPSCVDRQQLWKCESRCN